MTKKEQKHDLLPFQMEMDFSYGQPKEIWPGVRRIVCNNPSSLTHHGTNTYIIGENNLIIIDPGPDDKDHLKAILSATNKQKIAYILITHRHKDHSLLAPFLAEKTGAKICAFSKEVLPEQGGVFGTDHIDYDLKIDQALDDGDEIAVGGVTMQAIYTPGHAVDHLCFALKEQPVLFSGDHVMGWNTTVIAPPDGNMNDYLKSLTKLLGYQYERFLPAHGGQVAKPNRLVKAYLMHRKMRERDILNLLRDGQSLVAEMVPILYPKLSSKLVRAASLSVFSHLVALCEDGAVRSSCQQPSLKSAFSLRAANSAS